MFQSKENFDKLYEKKFLPFSVKKFENLQKQALRFLYKSYNLSYEDLLLKSGFSSMKEKRLRTLSVEIFKTLNRLNPTFMK